MFNTSFDRRLNWKLYGKFDFSENFCIERNDISNSREIDIMIFSVDTKPYFKFQNIIW